jgi:hypothetical protein
VFHQAATAADEPPSAVTGMPGLKIAQARLAAHRGPWRVYLVAGTLDGRRSLCVFAVVHDRSRFGCDPPGTARGYGFPEADGEPGAVAATVPDGVDEVTFEFRRGIVLVAVENNTAFARQDPWPEGPETITWTDRAGERHEAPIKSP